MMLAERLNADITRLATERAAANGTTADVETAAIKAEMATAAAIDAAALDAILGGDVSMVTDAHLTAFSGVLGTPLPDLQAALAADKAAPAEPPDVEIELPGMPGMMAALRSSVVRISNLTGHGSGVLMEDGSILTAAHVVEGVAEGFEVLSADGTKISSGSVIRVDKVRDLALVRSKDTMPGTRVKVHSGKVIHGDDVVVVGYPTAGGKEFRGMVTKGHVTYLEDGAIYTDAAINPGNSGGGMFIGGKLAGIVSARYMTGDGLFSSGGPAGIAFGCSADHINKFLAGEVSPMSASNPAEGLTLLTDLSAQVATLSQRVLALTAESLAFRAAATQAATAASGTDAQTAEIAGLKQRLGSMQEAVATTIMDSEKIPAHLRGHVKPSIMAALVAGKTVEEVTASLRPGAATPPPSAPPKTPPAFPPSTPPVGTAGANFWQKMTTVPASRN